MMNRIWGPASAGPWRATAWLSILALAFGACASPFADDEVSVSDVPLDEFAEPASEAPVAVEIEPPSADVPNDDGATTSTSTSFPESTSSTSAAPTTTASEPTSARLDPLRFSDPSGDADPGPGYADADLLAFDDLGDELRVTVSVVGDVPSTLADSEVMGIGVDFSRSDEAESDYQLFADGGSDGWRAFLQTPEGFVQYPGQFAVGGDLVQFTIPWTSVGGRQTWLLSGFVDWGRPNALGLVERSSDLVPDGEGGGLLSG